MTSGAVVLTVPPFIAALIWWWRTRSRGKPGKSLPTFLLGYLGAFTYDGLTESAHQWSHPRELSSYVSWVLLATLVSYFLGGVGWWILASVKRPLLRAVSWWLSTREDRETHTLEFGEVMGSDRDAAIQDARQRAIEECAEQAYDYFIESEVARAADYDGTERIAARLREAILALGEQSPYAS